MSKKNIKHSFGEEVANTVTHGVSSLLILFALPLVSIVAYTKGTIVDVISVTIFCISIFMMFLMSTLYHAMQQVFASSCIKNISKL